MGEWRGTAEEDDTLSVFGDEDTLPIYSSCLPSTHHRKSKQRNQQYKEGLFDTYSLAAGYIRYKHIVVAVIGSSETIQLYSP